MAPFNTVSSWCGRLGFVAIRVGKSAWKDCWHVGNQIQLHGLRIASPLKEFLEVLNERAGHRPLAPLSSHCTPPLQWSASTLSDNGTTIQSRFHTTQLNPLQLSRVRPLKRLGLKTSLRHHDTMLNSCLFNQRRGQCSQRI